MFIYALTEDEDYYVQVRIVGTGSFGGGAERILGKITGGRSDEEEEEALREKFVEVPFEEGQTQIYGDVQSEHCRVAEMMGYWYCSALESKIGTLVDSVKVRESDGFLSWKQISQWQAWLQS